MCPVTVINTRITTGYENFHNTFYSFRNNGNNNNALPKPKKVASLKFPPVASFPLQFCAK